MEREEYFEYMRETSDFIHPVIRRYVDPFRTTDAELYDTLMFFIGTRLNQPLLKPTLLRLCYEICAGNDWKKILPVAAAFEFLNISSYQANSAFDNKLGISTRAAKDSQFIASMITRELSHSASCEIRKDYDESVVMEILGSLSRISYNIYLAQHYDLNLLSIRRYENFRDEESYLRHYLNRCYLGSGIFNGECAYIGGLLANGEKEQIGRLRKFGDSYGTALQMINDLGDFVPAGNDGFIGRTFQDQYSDFRNGRLTLPLYHLLRFGDSMTVERLRSILDRKNYARESLEAITFLIIENGTISYVKEKARGFVKEAKQQLSSFNNSKSKNLLQVLLSGIFTNKYLVEFRIAQGEASSTVAKRS